MRTATSFEKRNHLPRLVIALAVSLLAPLTLAAQPPDPDVRAKRNELERQVLTAFNARDLDKAESLLREWIQLRPMEFVPVYNLACVLALRGQAEEGAEQLLKAVSLGFTDRATIERDDSLAAVRATETYRNLLATWPAVLDHVIDDRLERARKGFSKKYVFEKDPDLRLAFASGFPEESFKAAREEIERLAKWWKTEVLPEGTPAVVSDGDSPDPWVMVILPTQQDFASWAARNFPRREGALSRIGGVYDNDKKELVSGDLGTSFRHEFLHVLHWRHNTRLGQTHPIWVQEGLCSLVEDVQVTPEGKVIPTPSWRTNSLKRRAAGTRVSIEALTKMPREKFTGSAPLANYALARAVFLYLSAKGKLRDWYATYCDNFADDPAGKRAFEQTLGKPMDQIEKDFRIWLAKLPEVSEEGKPVSATLPIEVSAGAGDGLVVDSVARGVMQLMPRDVITAIDGKPVRDMSEYARIVGDYSVGTQVELTYRRGSKTAIARLQIIAGK